MIVHYQLHEERELKRIARIWCLNCLGFVSIFLYFAYNFDSGAARCFAYTTEKESNEHVLDGKPQHGGYTDVAMTMRGWFGALACLFGLMGSLWAAMLFGDAKQWAPIVIGVGNPFGVIHITCWIFLFISRYSFAGEVCSGSYLTAEDYEKDPDIERKYLVDMGAFI